MPSLLVGDGLVSQVSGGSIGSGGGGRGGRPHVVLVMATVQAIANLIWWHYGLRDPAL